MENLLGEGEGIGGIIDGDPGGEAEAEDTGQDAQVGSGEETHAGWALP